MDIMAFFKFYGPVFLVGGAILYIYLKYIDKDTPVSESATEDEKVNDEVNMKPHTTTMANIKGNDITNNIVKAHFKILAIENLIGFVGLIIFLTVFDMWGLVQKWWEIFVR